MNEQQTTEEIVVPHGVFGRWGDEYARYIPLELWATRDVKTGELSFYARLRQPETKLTSLRNFVVVVLCFAWGFKILAGSLRLWKDADIICSIDQFITGTLERWQHLRGWNPEDPEYLAEDECRD